MKKIVFILMLAAFFLPALVSAVELTPSWDKSSGEKLTILEGDSAVFYIEGSGIVPNKLNIALFDANMIAKHTYANDESVLVDVLGKDVYRYTITPSHYGKTGSYKLQSILTDSWGSSVTKSLILEVQQPKINQKPLANAGGDFTVKVILGGTGVVLDGSKSSDADGDALTYQWTQVAQVGVESVAIKDANTAKASFIPGKLGQYGFQLTVNDGKDSASAQVKVVVEKFNRGPVAKVAASVLSSKVGEKVILDGSLSADPDGDALTYTWKQISGIAVSIAATAKPEFTAATAGTYVFQLQVGDGEFLSNVEQVTVVVGAAQQPPSQNQKPIANAGSDFKMALGGNVTLDGSKSFDPEGKQLKYAWGVVDFPGENSFTLSGENTVAPVFTAKLEGVFTLLLQVDDGELKSEGAVLRITVEKSAPQPPQPRVAEFNVVEDSVEVNVIQGGKIGQNISIENKALADVAGFTAAVKFNESVDGVVAVRLLPGIAKANATTSFTFEVSVSDSVDVDDYSGVVTITREGKSDSFALKLRVLPDICPALSSKSQLKVTIREPKRGKDVKPGDVIGIEADVRNTGSKDLDVGVEAELWNLKTGNVIASVEADAQEIEKNKKESFEMQLEVPSNDDVNEREDLVLFVRAFEDGDEERVCSYEQKELDVKREDFEIMIADFVITPQTASCSQRNVNFRIGLENIGEKKDESVEIQLVNDELGMSLREGPFTLKEFDESDNSIVKGLSFTLPREVAEGSYTILLDVLSHDGKEKKTLSKTLVVEGCGGEQGLTPSLLTLFGQEDAASNEKVIPRGLSVSVLSEDNMLIAAMISGIVLLLIAIVYAMKVLARGG